MAEPLTVAKLYEDNRKKLRLRLVNGKSGFRRQITSAKTNRPGLELTGFWQYFNKDRVQLFGLKEKRYLDTISEKQKQQIFTKLFQESVPAVIFAHQTQPCDIAVRMAKKYKVAIFKSTMLTTPLSQFLMDYLDWNLAPNVVMHGSLVDVYGVGILFTGRSGIGKSEITLDLVERGHRLVADDSVRIIRRADNVIIGLGHEFLEHHIEVRGLGIIDVARMFGVRAIRKQKRVEVQVELEDWDENKNYDRIGTQEESIKILDVETPLTRLPIYPGKNITVIAEVIALNHMLKIYGRNAAKEFEKRLEIEIKQKMRKNQVEAYLKKDFE